MDVLGAGKILRNPYSKKKSKRNKSFFALIIFLSALAVLLTSFFVTLLLHAYNLPHSHDKELGNNVDIVRGKDSAVTSTSTAAANGEETQRQPAPAVIAYAISLTSCKESPSLVDGAAMLAHSIHLSSVRNTNTETGQPPSKYDYKLYAFFHKSIIEEQQGGSTEGEGDGNNNKCVSILEKLGYEIVVVDIPVPLDEIQNDNLREKLPQNGCCGEKEFIKLWAYTLIRHPFVVHLDLDTIVLRPMDEIFDFGLFGTPLTKKVAQNDIHMNISANGGIESEEAKKDVIMWNKEEQNSITNWSKINAFFTRDYNMRKAGLRPVGVQGGFLIIRPSQRIFEEFQSIIREGNFHSTKGWGGLGYQFYGAMTFQGIIPYFYDIIQPNTSLELNRCVYNTMADNPRDQRTVNNVVSGKCRDGRTDCEDCREREIEDIRTAHFTLCQKPWNCLPHKSDLLQQRLCRKLFAEWYKVRADLELSWEGKSLLKEEMRKGNGEKVVVGDGSFDSENFRGFCTTSGNKGYIPLKLPAHV